MTIAAALLDTCGFERRDARGDGLTVESGTLSTWASGTNAAPGGGLRSLSWTAVCSAVRLWRHQAAASEYALIGAWMSSAFVAGTAAMSASAANATATGIGVSHDTSGHAQLRVAGSVVATSAAPAFGSSSWNRIRIEVDHQDGGTVELFVNGVSVASHTLTSGNIAAMGGLPDRWRWSKTGSGGTVYLDDFAAVDVADLATAGLVPADLATLAVHPHLPTGAGARQEGTGAYTAIDELPMSASDGVVFDAVGEGADYTVSAHPGVSRQVIAVVGAAYLQKVGSGAGDHVVPYVAQGGLEAPVAPIAAPADGTIEWEIPTARDGTAWELTGPADFNAHTFGLETAV